MSKTKRTSFEKTLEIIADVVEGQLSKLPPEIADAKRKKISLIASSAGRPARGKLSKPSRTRARRLSTRSRA
jgi:hypothetical protein